MIPKAKNNHKENFHKLNTTFYFITLFELEFPFFNF